MLKVALPILFVVAAIPSASAAPTSGRERAAARSLDASAGLPTPPAPDAAPAGAKMVRIRFRDVTHPLPAGSFGAKPKTLYRLGEKYGRMEEEPDPERRIHGLIIVAEPRVWMVNRVDMSGQTVVDPGPSFVFRAPIIPAEEGGPQPPMLELGMEYAFLREHGASATAGPGKGEEQLSATVDGYAITLVGEAGKARPKRIRVAKGGETLVELEYLEFANDLAPRMELFVPPAGVRYRER